MIEQTPMTLSHWDYHAIEGITDPEALLGDITLDVMRKRNAIKKGIAVRFTCTISYENKPLLNCIGEHSYVIDLEDHIDLEELRNMIHFSYLAFREKYDIRKLNTVLKDIPLKAFDETQYDLSPLLDLLH